MTMTMVKMTMPLVNMVKTMAKMTMTMAQMAMTMAMTILMTMPHLYWSHSSSEDAGKLLPGED